MRPQPLADAATVQAATRRVPAVWTRRVSGWLAVSWMLLLGVTTVSLVIALQSALAGGPVSLRWVWVFLVFCAVLVCTLPAITLPALMAEGRVLRERRAPAAVWRQRLQGHERLLAGTVLVAALLLTLLRLLATPAPTTLGQALLPGAWVLAMGAGWLLLAAASARLLPPAVGLGLVAVMWMAVQLGDSVVVLTVPDAAATARAEAAAPGAAALVVALLCAALGPLACVAVRRRLVQWHGPQALPAQRRDAQGGWVQQGLQWLRRPFERWRYIDGPAAAGLWTVLISQLPNQLATALRDPQASFFQPWDSTVTPLHALRLLLLVALAMAVLRTDTLHWRCLLAPAGHTRRHLGPRIIGGTLMAVLLSASLLLGVGLLVTLLLPVGTAIPWGRLPAAAAAAAVPLAADLLLATALATWLRGAAGTPGRAWLGCGAAALVLAACLLALGLWPGLPSIQEQVLWTRGSGHLAATLALAAVFTLAAQRVWRRADLAALGRAAAAARKRQDEAG